MGSPCANTPDSKDEFKEEMSEAIIVGVLFLLIVSATTFYLYSRLMYSERKIGLMENLLLDIKMSLEMEREIHPHEHEHDEPKVDILEPSFTQEVKDDVESYTSVLENIPTETVTSVVESVVEQSDSGVKAPVNFDSMTRDELAALAEKKGHRVLKRHTKQQLLAMVRESEKNTSGGFETGTDGPVGGNTGTVEGASLLSGEADDLSLENSQ
jgi:hypothetical protein